MMNRIVMTLLIVVSAGLTGIGCSSKKQPAPPPAAVSVAAPQLRTEPLATRYSGTVEPNSSVDLAFRVGGYVQEITTVSDGKGRRRNLDQGDPIRKGATLVRLRQTEYLAKVGQAESQKNEGIAQMAQAKLDYDRAVRLYEKDSLTKPELDAARARFESIQAKVDGAGALVRESQVAAGDTVLRAPFDGVVVNRHVEVGSLVGSGSPAFQIADTSSVKIFFGVPDVMLESIRVGDLLPLKTEAYGERRFVGRVTSISPAADPRSRTYRVEMTISNPKQELKMGMVVGLEISDKATTPAAELVVPLSSIVRVPGADKQYGVFVSQSSEGRSVATLRPVKLGPVVGNAVIVREGVTDRDRIVTTGASLLRDGAAIQVIP